MIKKLSITIMSIILLQPLSLLSMTGPEHALIEARQTVSESTNIRQLRASYDIYQTRYHNICNNLNNQVQLHEIQSATHSERGGWGLFGLGLFLLGAGLTQEMLCKDASCEDKPSLKPLLLSGTVINLVHAGYEFVKTYKAEWNKSDAQEERQKFFQHHGYFLRGTYFRLEDETEQLINLNDIIVARKEAFKAKTKIHHVN